jgi:hypothetical protein
MRSTMDSLGSGDVEGAHRHDVKAFGKDIGADIPDLRGSLTAISAIHAMAPQPGANVQRPTPRLGRRAMLGPRESTASPRANRKDVLAIIQRPTTALAAIAATRTSSHGHVRGML